MTKIFEFKATGRSISSGHNEFKSIRRNIWQKNILNLRSLEETFFSEIILNLGKRYLEDVYCKRFADD